MPSKYTDEQRAAVIIDFKAGSSLNQLVQTHGVPKSTAKRWCAGVERATAPPAALKKLPGPRVPSYSDDWLEERAARLVESSFDAIEAINRLAAGSQSRTPGEALTWAERQNAHDLAIFQGVVADKLIRVLSSRSRPPANGDIIDQAAD